MVRKGDAESGSRGGLAVSSLGAFVIWGNSYQWKEEFHWSLTKSPSESEIPPLCKREVDWIIPKFSPGSKLYAWTSGGYVDPGAVEGCLHFLRKTSVLVDLK